MSDKTLFERIGGEDTLDALVNLFYRKVLADNELSSFFDGVDMDEQRAKQKLFLTAAFGGSDNYSGDDQGDAHEHLVEKHLSTSQFVSVSVYLRATLEELNVPATEIVDVMAIAGAIIAHMFNQYPSVAKETGRSSAKAL